MESFLFGCSVAADTGSVPNCAVLCYVYHQWRVIGAVGG